MTIETFLRVKERTNSTSEFDEIVMSTRIRLARNMKQFRFPTIYSEQEASAVEEKIKEALQEKLKECTFEYFQMRKLTSLQRQILVEKHLISPFLTKLNKTGGVFISSDESITILVNEEDHLRIQSFQQGLNIQTAYDQAIALNDELMEKLHFAYDAQFGYLTSCPTNVGTGLRASVMVHLPALTMMKKMNHLIQALTRLGMTVRGIYGEGSENLGNVYQISNQITLGKSDEEILQDLQQVVEQIVQKERAARSHLMNEAPLLLEDRIFRSLGTVMYARILSSEEASTCLSNIRFGIDLGLINNISRAKLFECMILIQPGLLQQFAGATLQPTERDLYRAKILQQQLLQNNESETTFLKGDDSYDV